MAKSMIVQTAQVGPIMTNAYVVGCPETHQGAIIDPGDEARRLLLLAEADELEITKVLITHGHVDHVAAVGDVKKATGAEVLVHEAERPAYDNCVAQGMMFGIRASEPPPPDGTLSDGDVIEIGQLRAKVIATPGHSPGGVSFYFEEQELVFVGDTLFQGSIGRTDLPGGSLEELMKNIHTRLLTLPEDTRVLCGHGPSTTVGVEKRTNPFVLEFAATS